MQARDGNFIVFLRVISTSLYDLKISRTELQESFFSIDSMPRIFNSNDYIVKFPTKALQPF